MGASLKTNQMSGGRRGRKRRHAPMSEINVTPFVDVMLVLLIIFMVAAPLLLSGLPVELPAAKGKSLNPDKDLLTVTVDREGKIFIGTAEQPIEVAELVAKIKAMAKNGLEENILFRGDRTVAYGRVAEVMGAVHDGGFTKFKFVYGPEEIATGPAKGK
ncbi:MAG: biopolymer transporter ExbD [Pseudomonadota bacterium]